MADLVALPDLGVLTSTWRGRRREEKRRNNQEVY